MTKEKSLHFASLRAGLAGLPRSPAHDPDAAVDPAAILIVAGHRAALDPERSLVVGNRGMGKSLWAHALADDAARARAAESFPELKQLCVKIGFNASQRIHSIAPTPSSVQDALSRTQDPDSIWRAILIRAAAEFDVRDDQAPVSETLTSLARWAINNGERVDRLLTALDDQILRSRRTFVLVFDALDRLASNWDAISQLNAALLKRALAVRSYRAIRMKLFMRRDQFDDPRLFEFPDGSKMKNTRVDLKWSSTDLYALLFARLSQSEKALPAFKRLLSLLGHATQQKPPVLEESDQKRIVGALAGEFMGSDKKRGRVYSWLPLHLADARGETSPRSFLTAWREAALHSPLPKGRAVDHLGLTEGVRKASEDRLEELREDYWWISTALDPLRGQMVPMERGRLEEVWRTAGTVATILSQADESRLAPVQLERSQRARETLLVEALASIGVIEIRTNDKINVPDIFRVEAGIKRKGGVRPPTRVKVL